MVGGWIFRVSWNPCAPVTGLSGVAIQMNPGPVHADVNRTQWHIPDLGGPIMDTIMFNDRFVVLLIT